MERDVTESAISVSPEDVAEVRFAGFFVRFLARFVDFMLLLGVINLLYYMDRMGGMRGWWPPMPMPDEIVKNMPVQEMAVNIIRLLFYAGISPLYYIVMHGMGGQTLGKMAFRIKVVNVSGGEISMGSSILRWIGYVVCDLTLWIGYMVVAFSETKQGLHDKIAKTYVITL